MFRNRLLKRAYGLDQMGEVHEMGGQGKNDSQENIEDTAEPQDHHMTPPNPVNTMVDTEAQREFPGLQGRRGIQRFRGVRD
jgi:hypothetical protein